MPKTYLDDSLTLREGLIRFREENHKYFSNRPMSKEGKVFIDHHDIAHVVFGCDASIVGEGKVKIWTTFGSNWGFWKMIRGYQSVRAHELAQDFSVRHVLKNIFRLLIVIPRTIIRTSRMKKPWPFDGYQNFLDRPVAMIRIEFGIRII